MKYLIFMALAMSSTSFAADCKEEIYSSNEDVVYEVNSKIPEHLRGATITVRLADGKESTVPAEKFMVVPRKQSTIAGTNWTVTKVRSCDTKDRNLIIGEVRKDHKNFDTETNGKEAKTYSNKEVIPGVNYFRRELLGPIGAGAGVDSNGTLKGLIGVEF